MNLYACPGRSSNAGLVVGSGPLPFSNAGFVEGLTVSGFSGGCPTPSIIGGLSGPVGLSGLPPGRSGFVVVGQPSFSFAQHHAFFSGDQLSLV